MSIKIDLETKEYNYTSLLEDILKFSTIIITTHLFLSFTKMEYSFFDPQFFQGLFVIILSLIIYWLVIKKLI